MDPDLTRFLSKINLKKSLKKTSKNLRIIENHFLRMCELISQPVFLSIHPQKDHIEEKTRRYSDIIITMKRRYV